MTQKPHNKNSRRESRVPSLAGEGDLIVHPGKHAEPLAEVIPDAELRMVPKQGHFFHYAVPDQVVAAVDEVTDRAG